MLPAAAVAAVHMAWLRCRPPLSRRLLCSSYCSWEYSSSGCILWHNTTSRLSSEHFSNNSILYLSNCCHKSHGTRILHP
jgi:hypothetical protein